MNNNESTIEEIELNIKEAKEFVKLGESLKRLEKNRDFQRVIKDGFFRDEAVRLVHLRGDPALQRPETQSAIMRDIDGINTLRGYLQQLHGQAEAAKEAIRENEETIEEMRAEEQAEEDEA